VVGVSGVRVHVGRGPAARGRPAHRDVRVVRGVCVVLPGTPGPLAARGRATGRLCPSRSLFCPASPVRAQPRACAPL